MNIEDTVKALRQCANEVTCNGCAFSAPGMTGDCRENMMVDAADQLEQLKAEKTTLESRLKQLDIHFGKLVEQLQFDNERLKAEIEQLKGFEKDKKDCAHYIEQENGMCISPYRSSVVCCGTKCGSFICAEQGRMRSE